jgi:hypothetical protein
MGLFGKMAQALNSNHENARLTNHQNDRLARNLSEAETRYLEVLRREIANLIVASDPDLLMRCYQKAWTFEREIADSPQRAIAEEAALVAKFPMFEDFDLIATRHFVPYHEARSRWSDDDLVERYQEVSRMLVFMRRRQNLAGVGPVHDAKEEKILRNCMGRDKDRKFRQRIEDAIRRFYAYRAGLEKGDPTTFAAATYEDAEVQIIRLPSLPDNEYGITFKKTDEFGVYSFHVFDTGEVSYSYYRSDALFNERKMK